MRPGDAEARRSDVSSRPRKMRQAGDRDKLPLVGQTARAAIKRALAADLPPSAIKVALALDYFLLGATRVEDAVSYEQLVELTKLHPRTVRGALKLLKLAGSHGYEPGDSPRGGRRFVSWVQYSSDLIGSDHLDPGSLDAPGTFGDRESLKAPGTGGEKEQRPGAKAARNRGSPAAPLTSSSREGHEKRRPPASPAVDAMDLGTHHRRRVETHARNLARVEEELGEDCIATVLRGDLDGRLGQRSLDVLVSEGVAAYRQERMRRAVEDDG